MVNISYIHKMMIMMLNHEIWGYWVNYPIFSFFCAGLGFRFSLGHNSHPVHQPSSSQFQGTQFHRLSTLSTSCLFALCLALTNTGMFLVLFGHFWPEALLLGDPLRWVWERELFCSMEGREEPKNWPTIQWIYIRCNMNVQSCTY